MSMQGEKRAVSEIDAAIGTNIFKLREKAGLTRIYVAREIGVSVWQLSKYEAGMDRIAAGRLFRCSKALKVPIARLYAGIEVRRG
jgi:transcriptional regulator with XRE-family HTH domain